MESDKLLTEADLLRVLGVKKSVLTTFRSKGLPFVRLNSRSRLYFLSDLMEWCKTWRMVIDSSELPRETYSAKRETYSP